MLEPEHDLVVLLSSSEQMILMTQATQDHIARSVPRIRQIPCTRPPERLRPGASWNRPFVEDIRPREKLTGQPRPQESLPRVVAVEQVQNEQGRSICPEPRLVKRGRGALRKKEEGRRKKPKGR